MGTGEGILYRLLFSHGLYYVLAWSLAVVVALVLLFSGWHSFDNAYVDDHRRDGNAGHATIDFGGQYLMGRMLFDGHGRHLYERSVQRLVLEEVYPVADQNPEAKRSDAENMMFWMMGTDEPNAAEALSSFLAPLAARDGAGVALFLAAGQQEWSGELLEHASARRIGGPLYPPVNAFMSAPLALLPAHDAYHMQQVVNVLLAFLAGLGVSVLSRRGVWWPVATLVIMIFPGFIGSLNLGQNATLTLTILIWGWVHIGRGRPGWGGLIWGLLAFKPVWALAFLLVLMLTRRWRAGLAMCVTGAGLVLLSLPFVGVQSWLDWLHVGREAADLYNTDKNWIFLSRDLLSIPRRWFLEFADGAARMPDRHPDPLGPSRWWWLLFGGKEVPGWLIPQLAGWILVGAVLEITVRLAMLRPLSRAVTGPPAAFVLLGAWMCCFHFMYYDVLLAALPVFLLFTEPRRYLEPILLVVRPLSKGDLESNLERYYHLHLPRALLPDPPPLALEYRHIWVVNRLFPTTVVLLLLVQPLFPYFGWPWDTFVLMLMWLWCGWLSRAEPAA